MNLKNTIENIIEILKIEEDFFCEEIKRFNELKLRNTIRIGLIGITSTGKSTLLNSFIGEDILPRNVRPTSNVPILCKKSNDKILHVFFEENYKETIKGSLIKEKLSEYADETNNKMNKFRVSEIHLYHPNFIFGEQVEIYDSPGLDAYGLENHEKITLSTLLPTLDCVFYLTTMKATTDEKNLEYLSQIVKSKIDFLIIQNMKDSVEPKLGRGGIIEKTKEEVLLEHKNRVRKILLKIDPKLSEKTTIIQISALWALNNRIKDSNIEELINYVKNLINYSAEKYQKQRFNQIINIIDEIIKNGKEEIKKYEKEIKYLEDDLQEFDNTCKQKILEIKNIFIRIHSILSNSIQQIMMLTEKSLDNAKNLISNINNSLNYQIDLAVTSIIKFYEYINTKIKNYNINDSDIKDNFHMQVLKQNLDLNVKYKNIKKEREYWIDKEGIWNTGKRFLGKIFGKESWGREKHKEFYYEKFLDMEKMIEELREKIYKFENVFNDAHKKLTNYFSKAYEKCFDVLKNKKHSLNKKLNLIPNLSKDKIDRLFQVFEKLKIIKAKIVQTQDSQSINEKFEVAKFLQTCHPTGKDFKILEINKFFLDLFHISEMILNSYFRAIFKFCLSLIESQQKNIYFYGYEIEKLEQFFRKIFNRSINLKHGISLFNFNEKINFYFDIPPYYDLSFCINKDEIINKSEIFFIMLDIVQIGSTENKLSKSELIKEIINRNKKIIIVMDEIKSLINDASLSEALVQLLMVLNRMNINPILYLVNDQSPLYSIAINKMIKIINDEKIISEQHYIEYLRKTCGPILTLEKEQILGRVLREMKKIYSLEVSYEK